MSMINDLRQVIEAERFAVDDIKIVEERGKVWVHFDAGGQTYSGVWKRAEASQKALAFISSVAGKKRGPKPMVAKVDYKEDGDHGREE